MEHTGQIHGSNLKRTEIDDRKFASPLNFSPYFASYYNMYEEDQLFGANYDAYSTRWTGGASQATRETGPSASENAVRWAIASAENIQEPAQTREDATTSIKSMQQKCDVMTPPLRRLLY